MATLVSSALHINFPINSDLLEYFFQHYQLSGTIMFQYGWFILSFVELIILPSSPEAQSRGKRIFLWHSAPKARKYSTSWKYRLSEKPTEMQIKNSPGTQTKHI